MPPPPGRRVARPGVGQDDKPALWWDPGWLASAQPMVNEGELAGSPFPTFDAAAAAVATRRVERGGSPPPGERVFLVTWAPKGWVVFEYAEHDLSQADLKELSPRGMPLGGDVVNPRTYVVDAKGRFGRLARTDAGYAWTPFDRANEPGPTPPAGYVPAVVPEPLRNHGANVEWSPRIALRPGPNPDELRDALRWVHQNLDPAVSVKGGGWRHSWSPVAATDGVYVHPEHLRGIEHVAASAAVRSLLRPGVEASTLFQVLSGTRIRHINAALWAAGCALPVLGGWDGQTLAGVLQTGTHGSVLRFGPLAEMVRSVDLIRPDGRAVRVEPGADPVSDPTAFALARPAWDLEQDDDAFHAVLISMGSMGIIYSFIIQATARFWLKEVRTVTTMGEAAPVLRDGNIYHLMEAAAPPGGIPPADSRAFAGHPKPAYHLELLWNPYTDKLVVTSRHPVDDATRREFERAEPAWFAQPPTRNLFRALKLDAMADEYSRPDLPELATEHFSGSLGEVIETIVKLRPQLLPQFLDNSLDGMADPSYIQRSYNVFNVGEGANMIPALSSTISLPLRDDRWLDGIDTIRQTARDAAARRRQYQTGPISLRFVRGSKILLADPEDVCKFEIIFGGNNERVRELAYDLVKAHYDALYTRLGSDVRFHWGQIIPDGTLDTPGTRGHRVRESFPEYATWRAIRDRYDPGGRGLNPWQRRMLP